MKLSEIRIDPRLLQGAWVRDIPGMDGLALKVRPAGNVDAQRIYRGKIAAIPRVKTLRGVDPADERAATDESILGGILLDWSGLTDDEGNAVPYSAALARELVTSPETESFRDAVLFASVMVKDLGEVNLKDDVGN